MSKVELVVMDIAGTTVRDLDFVGVCVRDALHAVGCMATLEELAPHMGIPKPVMIRETLDRHGVQADVEAVHQDFKARMIRFYAESPDVAEIPGASDVFARLRESGVKVALDTGFSRDITDVILQRLGWDDGRLDTTVTSDEVAAGRPAPDLILEAMRRVGVSDPVRVAKVGDTPSDLGEGTAAGCGWVVGVLEGTNPEEELVRHPHTHLIPNIAHLPAVLGL